MAGEYDSRFELIVARVIAREGGYVNHPNDKGGPTKYGITIPFLAESRDMDHREITPGMIRGLTIDEARRAYHTMIWQRAGVNSLPAEMQQIMFDWITMSGTRAPVKILQLHIGAKQDGIIGPNTAKAARQALAEKPWPEFRVDFIHDIIRFLIKIARNDPTQVVFLEGWFNRFCDYYA